VASNRRLMVRRSTTRTSIAIGLLALAAGAVAVGIFQFPGIALLAVAAVYVVCYVGAVWVMPQLAWRRRPDLASPRCYAFSDEGVEARAPHTEMKIDWAPYTRALENSHFYLVEMRDSPHYLCVPKRTFASRSDELFLREMVDRHTEAHLLPK
jgi:hypothetical protein